MLAACQTMDQGDEAPARIDAPDSASRAALRAAVTSALQREVLLADDALTGDDTLTVERRAPATPEGRLATGRNMDEPVQFHLVIADGKCVLIDTRNGHRYTLADTRCSAL